MAQDLKPYKIDVVYTVTRRARLTLEFAGSNP